MKKLLGLIIFLVGVGGLALSGAGLVFGRQAINTLATNLDSSYQLTADSLDNLINTLVLVKTAATDITTTLETAQTTADGVATAVQETRPFVDQINVITTENVPATLEEVQTAIPNIAQVAAVVDNTLTTLNNFRLDEGYTFNIPLVGEYTIPLQFDLGIDYTPTEPFDQTINNLGASLDGLPDQLRTLETYLNVTSSSLNTISQDVHVLADNLTAVNGSLNQLTPLLDEYLRLATQAKTQLSQLRTGLDSQINTLQLLLTVTLIWLALSQLVPLYLGWELLGGKPSAISHQPLASPPKADS